MILSEAQRTQFLYDTFLKASKEADLRPDGATDAQLYAHMEGWKDGLFVASVQKTLQQEQLRTQAPTKKNLMGRLFGQK